MAMEEKEGRFWGVAGPEWCRQFSDLHNDQHIQGSSQARASLEATLQDLQAFCFDAHDTWDPESQEYGLVGPLLLAVEQILEAHVILRDNPEGIPHYVQAHLQASQRCILPLAWDDDQSHILCQWKCIDRGGIELSIYNTAGEGLEWHPKHQMADADVYSAVRVLTISRLLWEEEKGELTDAYCALLQALPKVHSAKALYTQWLPHAHAFLKAKEQPPHRHKRPLWITGQQASTWMGVCTVALMEDAMAPWEAKWLLYQYKHFNWLNHFNALEHEDEAVQAWDAHQRVTHYHQMVLAVKQLIQAHHAVSIMDTGGLPMPSKEEGLALFEQMRHCQALYRETDQPYACHLSQQEALEAKPCEFKVHVADATFEPRCHDELRHDAWLAAMQHLCAMENNVAHALHESDMPSWDALIDRMDNARAQWTDYRRTVHDVYGDRGAELPSLAQTCLGSVEGVLRDMASLCPELANRCRAPWWDVLIQWVHHPGLSDVLHGHAMESMLKACHELSYGACQEAWGAVLFEESRVLYEQAHGMSPAQWKQDANTLLGYRHSSDVAAWLGSNLPQPELEKIPFLCLCLAAWGQLQWRQAEQSQPDAFERPDELREAYRIKTEGMAWMQSPPAQALLKKIQVWCGFVEWMKDVAHTDDKEWFPVKHPAVRGTYRETYCSVEKTKGKRTGTLRIAGKQSGQFRHLATCFVLFEGSMGPYLAPVVKAWLSVADVAFCDSLVMYEWKKRAFRQDQRPDVLSLEYLSVLLNHYALQSHTVASRALSGWMTNPAYQVVHMLDHVDSHPGILRDPHWRAALDALLWHRMGSNRAVWDEDVQYRLMHRLTYHMHHHNTELVIPSLLKIVLKVKWRVLLGDDACYGPEEKQDHRLDEALWSEPMRVLGHCEQVARDDSTDEAFRQQTLLCQWLALECDVEAQSVSVDTMRRFLELARSTDFEGFAGFCDQAERDLFSRMVCIWVQRVQDHVAVFRRCLGLSEEAVCRPHLNCFMQVNDSIFYILRGGWLNDAGLSHVSCPSFLKQREDLQHILQGRWPESVMGSRQGDWFVIQHQGAALQVQKNGPVWRRMGDEVYRYVPPARVQIEHVHITFQDPSYVHWYRQSEKDGKDGLRVHNAQDELVWHSDQQAVEAEAYFRRDVLARSPELFDRLHAFEPLRYQSWYPSDQRIALPRYGLSFTWHEDELEGGPCQLKDGPYRLSVDNPAWDHPGVLCFVPDDDQQSTAQGYAWIPVRPFAIDHHGAVSRHTVFVPFKLDPRDQRLGQDMQAELLDARKARLIRVPLDREGRPCPQDSTQAFALAYLEAGALRAEPAVRWLRHIIDCWSGVSGTELEWDMMCALFDSVWGEGPGAVHSADFKALRVHCLWSLLPLVRRGLEAPWQSIQDEALRAKVKQFLARLPDTMSEAYRAYHHARCAVSPALQVSIRDIESLVWYLASQGASLKGVVAQQYVRQCQAYRQRGWVPRLWDEKDEQQDEDRFEPHITVWCANRVKIQGDVTHTDWLKGVSQVSLDPLEVPVCIPLWVVDPGTTYDTWIAKTRDILALCCSDATRDAFKVCCRRKLRALTIQNELYDAADASQKEKLTKYQDAVRCAWAIAHSQALRDTICDPDQDPGAAIREMGKVLSGWSGTCVVGGYAAPDRRAKNSQQQRQVHGGAHARPIDASPLYAYEPLDTDAKEPFPDMHVDPDVVDHAEESMLLPSYDAAVEEEEEEEVDEEEEAWHDANAMETSHQGQAMEAEDPLQDAIPPPAYHDPTAEDVALAWLEPDWLGRVRAVQSTLAQQKKELFDELSRELDQLKAEAEVKEEKKPEVSYIERQFAVVRSFERACGRMRLAAKQTLDELCDTCLPDEKAWSLKTETWSSQIEEQIAARREALEREQRVVLELLNHPEYRVDLAHAVEHPVGNMQQAVRLYSQGSPRKLADAIGVQLEAAQKAFWKLRAWVDQSCQLQRWERIQTRLQDVKDHPDDPYQKRHLLYEILAVNTLDDPVDEADHLLMAYQYFEGLLLRSEQKEALDLLRERDPDGRYQDALLQMVMGSGKSTVLNPLWVLLMRSEKGRLSVLEVPSALMHSSLQSLNRVVRRHFDQAVCQVSADRAALTNGKTVWGIYQQLEHAIRYRSVVLMTPATVSSLVLSYEACLWQCVQQGPSDALASRIEGLSCILKLIGQADVLMDEQARLLQVDKEHNFSLSKSEEGQFDDWVYEAVSGFLFALHEADPRLIDRLSHDPKSYDKAGFAQVLYEALYRDQGLDEKEVIAVLQGEQDVRTLDNSLDVTVKKTLGLMQDLLCRLFPVTSGKRYQEYYGEHDGRCVLMESLGVPDLQKRCANPLEAMLYTGQMCLLQGMTADVARKVFFEKVKQWKAELACYLDDEKLHSIDDLPAVRMFKAKYLQGYDCGQVSLTSVRAGDDGFFEDLACALQGHNGLLHRYLVEQLLPGVEWTERWLTCPAVKHQALFGGSSRGTTGTPWDRDAIGSVLFHEAHALGQDGLMEEVLSQSHVDPVQVAPSEDLDVLAWMRQCIEGHAQNGAWVDVGGWLRDVSPMEVARCILDIEVGDEKADDRHRFQHVLLHVEGRLCAVSYDPAGQVCCVPVSSTEPKALKRQLGDSYTPKGTYFVYDQAHREGFDIKQPPGSDRHAYVTLEHDTLLYDVQQGAYRMRRLADQQRWTCVVRAEWAEAIQGAAADGAQEHKIQPAKERASPQLSGDQVLEHVAYQQDQKRLDHHFKGSFPLIFNLFWRDAWSDLMAIPSEDVEAQVKCSERFAFAWLREASLTHLLEPGLVREEDVGPLLQAYAAQCMEAWLQAQGARVSDQKVADMQRAVDALCKERTQLCRRQELSRHGEPIDPGRAMEVEGEQDVQAEHKAERQRQWDMDVGQAMEVEAAQAVEVDQEMELKEERVQPPPVGLEAALYPQFEWLDDSQYDDYGIELLRQAGLRITRNVFLMDEKACAPHRVRQYPRWVWWTDDQELAWVSDWEAQALLDAGQAVYRVADPRLRAADFDEASLDAWEMVCWCAGQWSLLLDLAARRGVGAFVRQHRNACEALYARCVRAWLPDDADNSDKAVQDVWNDLDDAKLLACKQRYRALSALWGTVDIMTDTMWSVDKDALHAGSEEGWVSPQEVERLEAWVRAVVACADRHPYDELSDLRSKIERDPKVGELREAIDINDPVWSLAVEKLIDRLSEGKLKCLREACAQRDPVWMGRMMACVWEEARDPPTRVQLDMGPAFWLECWDTVCTEGAAYSYDLRVPWQWHMLLRCSGAALSAWSARHPDVAQGLLSAWLEAQKRGIVMGSPDQHARWVQSLIGHWDGDGVWHMNVADDEQAITWQCEALLRVTSQGGALGPVALSEDAQHKLVSYMARQQVWDGGSSERWLQLCYQLWKDAPYGDKPYRILGNVCLESDKSVVWLWSLLKALCASEQAVAPEAAVAEESKEPEVVVRDALEAKEPPAVVSQEAEVRWRVEALRGCSERAACVVVKQLMVAQWPTDESTMAWHCDVLLQVVSQGVDLSSVSLSQDAREALLSYMAGQQVWNQHGGAWLELVEPWWSGVSYEALSDVCLESDDAVNWLWALLARRHTGDAWEWNALLDCAEAAVRVLARRCVRFGRRMQVLADWMERHKAAQSIAPQAVHAVQSLLGRWDDVGVWHLDVAHNTGIMDARCAALWCVVSLGGKLQGVRWSPEARSALAPHIARQVQAASPEARAVWLELIPQLWADASYASLIDTCLRQGVSEAWLWSLLKQRYGPEGAWELSALRCCAEPAARALTARCVDDPERRGQLLSAWLARHPAAGRVTDRDVHAVQSLTGHWEDGVWHLDVTGGEAAIDARCNALLRVVALGGKLQGVSLSPSSQEALVSRMAERAVWNEERPSNWLEWVEQLWSGASYRAWGERCLGSMEARDWLWALLEKRWSPQDGNADVMWPLRALLDCSESAVRVLSGEHLDGSEREQILSSWLDGKSEDEKAPLPRLGGHHACWVQSLTGIWEEEKQELAAEEAEGSDEELEEKGLSVPPLESQPVDGLVWRMRVDKATIEASCEALLRVVSGGGQLEGTCLSEDAGRMLGEYVAEQVRSDGDRARHWLKLCVQLQAVPMYEGTWQHDVLCRLAGAFESEAKLTDAVRDGLSHAVLGSMTGSDAAWAELVAGCRTVWQPRPEAGLPEDAQLAALWEAVRCALPPAVLWSTVGEQKAGDLFRYHRDVMDRGARLEGERTVWEEAVIRLDTLLHELPAPEAEQVSERLSGALGHMVYCVCTLADEDTLPDATMQDWWRTMEEEGRRWPMRKRQLVVLAGCVVCATLLGLVCCACAGGGLVLGALTVMQQTLMAVCASIALTGTAWRVHGTLRFLSEQADKRDGLKHMFDNRM